MINPYLISTNYQKVLRFLLLRPGQSFYEREIARIAALSPSSVHYALARLHRDKLIRRKQNGRMCFYSLDIANPYLKEYKVMVNLLLIEPLVEKLMRISHKIVLFGSWADGSDTEDSDIDLFVVTSEKANVTSIIRKFSNSADIGSHRVQAAIYSPDELLERDKQDEVFLKEIEKGKILWERDINEDNL